MIRKFFKYSLILLPLLFPILVHADTTIDTSNWVNVTGRQWSLGTQDYHIGDLTVDTNWVKNYFNVPSGYYTPPNSFDYVTFSFFQHYGNTNPCDGSNYTASFKLKLTNTNFLNYINKVQFLDNVCNIVTDTNNGEITAICIVNYQSVSNSYLSIYFNEISGNTTSDLYLSRTINFTCGLNTQAIIDSSNQNTQNIINNNNQNTQSLIDSSASNTQALIDSNKSCKIYDNTNTIQSKTINDNGVEQSSNNVNVSDYISLSSDDELYLLNNTSSIVGNFCFYNINKSKISCTHARDISVGEITIPTNTSYFRYTISKTENKPTYKICKNGQQAITDSITGLDDTLNDDDTSGATSEASDFFSDFTTNTFGLTSIITAPLSLIQSLLTSGCSYLQLPLPYLNNKYLTLPCMSNIYSNFFGNFFTLYQTITYGIVAYWVCVRIFNLVKDFKNPEHDEIEVLDL